MSNFLFRSFIELSSRKTVSKTTGALAKSSVSRLFIRRFAKLYHINIEEAELPIQQYKSLNQFFSRRLKTGIRPINDTPSSCISPVDAVITGMGPIDDLTMLQVKGQDYRIDELLQNKKQAERYRNGYYFVLYLSPTDYHRIHVPVSGKVTEREHLPGRVYPVNEFGLTKMKKVLSRNERLVTYIDYTHGEIAVVKVGALNVSSIQYVLPLAEQVTKGDELAYFEFGSTVVLLMQENEFEVAANLSLGSRVKMGTALGQMTSMLSSKMQ
ncbi:archaetidylserine decarboxylase [Paenibacillus yanchengensis]|uniref:Phosphatidylserine decarboxylase proenzyme n=1 Tax=Paenibacillus yanchengensis TaxID=2035833 RepID=A0ABW4YLQ8_9BACL